MNDVSTPVPPSSVPNTGNDAAARSHRVFGWLASEGAQLRDDGSIDFGHPHDEASAALRGDVLAASSDFAVIRARGVDVDAFLQGQLSNDLRELTSVRAQFSSYSNPKGRVLALLTLLRRPNAVWLETTASVLEPTLKRLRLYVLRSKVVLDDAGAEAAALGISGPNAASLLAAAGLPAPAAIGECAEAADHGVTVLRRAGEPARFTIHGSAAELAALWPKLATKAKPVGSAGWHLLDVLAGVPSIHPETREQHVAQMMNVDQLGGISFTKGCYPGQEIVARLHYLGNLKRRMFVGRVSGGLPALGMQVFVGDGSSTQPVGDMLDVAKHPDGSHAVQVVLQLSSSELPLRLGSVDGREITLTQQQTHIK